VGEGKRRRRTHGRRQENWLGLLTDHTRLGEKRKEKWKNCCSLGEGGTIRGRYQGTITFMVVNSNKVKKNRGRRVRSNILWHQFLE
jgi:hypothetical protein